MRQRFTQSQKKLQVAMKRPLTFYKNIKMKVVRPQFRIISQQKNVHIQKTPWNSTLNQHQIIIILKRLNDTPTTLYSAFQQKINQNKQNMKVNTNKFKPLLNFAKKTNVKQGIKNKTTNYSKHRPLDKQSINIKKNEQEIEKQIQSIKQVNLLKKIRATKKKYIEQYHKILMSMKYINPDTNLPRIKYIEQNAMSDKINLMHGYTTLKIGR